MNIQAATCKALEKGGCITRESAACGKSICIRPTNTPDCCVVIEKISSTREWEPQAEDLLADDWEITI